MSAIPPTPPPDDPPVTPGAANPPAAALEADAAAGTAVAPPQAEAPTDAPADPSASSAADAAPDTGPGLAPGDVIPAPVSKVVAPPPAAGRQETRKKVPVRTEETADEALRSAESDGRTTQRSLLVMVPVTGDLAKLKEVLAYIVKNDPEDNHLLPLASVKSIHFCRFVVHDPAPNDFEAHFVRGAKIPPKLLFATDYDGEFEDHLNDLRAKVGPGLDEVFKYCQGYPGHADARAFHDWVIRFMVPSNTFYTGTMNRSVQQIRREAKLHDAVEDFLDAERAKPGFPTDPVQIRRRIQEFVFAHPDFQWVKTRSGPFPKPALPKALTSTPVLIGVVALVLVGLPALVGFLFPPLRPYAFGLVGLLVVAIVAAAVYLRYLEKTDRVLIRNDKDQVAELVKQEDHIVQNQMSSVIYIKYPLWFRRPVLSGVLAFINFGARYLSNTGTLAGIPSIHFARWVIVDEGRRLVFFSNFDGSWENYLGDFIDKASTGLTGVWTNCLGFPRTKFLFWGGATQEQKFKQYSRDSQIPTQLWYSAYKWLSVDNINNNTHIRLGMYDEMDAAAAQAWLRRF